MIIQLFIFKAFWYQTHDGQSKHPMVPAGHCPSIVILRVEASWRHWRDYFPGAVNCRIKWWRYTTQESFVNIFQFYILFLWELNETIVVSNPWCFTLLDTLYLGGFVWWRIYGWITCERRDDSSMASVLYLAWLTMKLLRWRRGLMTIGIP